MQFHSVEFQDTYLALEDSVYTGSHDKESEANIESPRQLNSCRLEKLNDTQIDLQKSNVSFHNDDTYHAFLSIIITLSSIQRNDMTRPYHTFNEGIDVEEHELLSPTPQPNTLHSNE